MIIEALACVLGWPVEVLDGKHRPCPVCGGRDRFRLIDPNTGAVYCNQCFNHDNGDIYSAIQHFGKCTFPEAVERVRAFLHGEVRLEASPKRQKPTKEKKTRETSIRYAGGNLVKTVTDANGRTREYPFHWDGYMYVPDNENPKCREVFFDYSDGLCNPRHLVQRLDFPDGRKSIRIEHWEESEGRFLPGAGDLPRLPFNACELKEAQKVYFVEGEKCAVALRKALEAAGVTADCAVTTTGGVNSWRDELACWFAGKNVTILPDNDAPGRKFAETALRALSGVAKSVRIRDMWAGGSWPEKYDIADWLRDTEGREMMNIEELIDHQIEVTITPKDSDANCKTATVEGLGLPGRVGTPAVRRRGTLWERFGEESARGRFFYHGARWYMYEDDKGWLVCDDIDREVERILTRCGQTFKTGDVSDFVRGMRGRFSLPGSLDDVPAVWLTVPEAGPCYGKSAVDWLATLSHCVNVRTGEVRPRTSDLLTLGRVPCAYDPEAKCPQWLDFIGRACPYDRESLQKMFGLSLTYDRRWGVFFVVYGEAGTGKSTALEVLGALNTGVTCSVSLGSLGERFAVYPLTENRLDL